MARARRTPFGTTPLYGLAGHGFGATPGASVAVVAPPVSTLGVGGARAPMDLGRAILARETGFRAVTSDKPCIDLWTCLLFDVPCNQALSLVYNDIYVEAQTAMRALASVEPAPSERWFYVALVGAYGWVMTWAAGVENICLPITGAPATKGLLDPTGLGYGAYAFHTMVQHRLHSTDPLTTVEQNSWVGGATSPGLGMARSIGSHPSGSGDLPITISQLNLDRCNPSKWNTTPFPNDPGAVAVAAARTVAQSLSNYSVIDLLADAWARYAAQAAVWKEAGVDISLDANAAGQLALKQQAARVWQGTQQAAAGAGAAASIDPTGTAGFLSKITQAVLLLFSLLPAASGGVTCPYPFLYRSSSNSDCSGSSTTPGGVEHIVSTQQARVQALVQAQSQARADILAQAQAAAPKKTSPLVVGGAVVGGLGLLVGLLRLLRRKR